MKVLIPSAKIVPEELQNLGKLPAIIYPVGQGIVFDYLLEQYRDKAEEINVLCYEMADEVIRGLSSYHESKVKTIRLEQLGDLGWTVYNGLKNICGPVVINFADTIVLDELPETNGFFYAIDYPSDIWTFFEEENGVLTFIRDKKAGTAAEKQQKLFVGVFCLRESEYFKECLERSFRHRDEQMGSFYQALVLYSQRYPLVPVQAEDWFDIGHADTYYHSKLEVKAREFNHITIDKQRGILKKSSEDKEKFIGEILWYLKLPADIEYVRPRIFSYSIAYNAPYVAMEYYSYHTVHELFLYGDLNYHQWRQIFSRIRFIYDDFQRYQIQDAGIKDALKEVYLDKTIQRLDRLRKDDRFAAFFDRAIEVNHVKYKSLNDICSLLREEIPKRLYNVSRFHIIHGDLCFANIMVDGNFSFIKVIDPRGKFGEYDIYGDQRYELAKLFHSVDGKYDFIIKDLFELNVNAQEAKIVYQVLERKREFNLYEVFLDVFLDEISNRQKEIELIEALLFLSMIPLHGESARHQYAMLATGIELLDRMLDIREK